MRFVLSILILLSLVACGDVESQPIPATSPTVSLIPTHTLEPSHTPQPTDTPEPTKTLTPIPAATTGPTNTPTPQVGEKRTSPDTSEEEVYNENGQWVETVQVGDVRKSEDGVALELYTESGWLKYTSDSVVESLLTVDGRIYFQDENGRYRQLDYILEPGQYVREERRGLVIDDGEGHVIAILENGEFREFHVWEIWPTEAEIEATLRDGSHNNTWPLPKARADAYFSLLGVVANPRVKTIGVGGGWEVKASADFYFLGSDGEVHNFAIPLFMRNDERNMSLNHIAGITMQQDFSQAELEERMIDRYSFDNPGDMMHQTNLRFERVQYTGEIMTQFNDFSISGADVAAMIYDANDVSAEAIESFVETSSMFYLPEFDGVKYLFSNIVYCQWLFPV